MHGPRDWTPAGGGGGGVANANAIRRIGQPFPHWVMLNKSVLNYYSHFSSFFPDFFPAIVFYSSRCIDSDKKKSRDIKK